MALLFLFYLAFYLSFSYKRMKRMGEVRADIGPWRLDSTGASQCRCGIAPYLPHLHMEIHAATTSMMTSSRPLLSIIQRHFHRNY